MAESQPDKILEQFPGYALRRAANAMMSEFAVRLAPLDLRISEVSVLLVVEHLQNLTSAEVGKALDIRSANMAPLLSRLEGAGLIGRRPINGRSMAIVLTEAGFSRLAEARKIIGVFEDELLERIPEEHRDHFMPALRALWRPATMSGS